MTPDNIREKGDELIQKFRNEFSWVEKDFPIDLWRDARQCAIIAVEEIIKVAWWQSTVEMKEPYRHSQKEYWEEVLNYLKSKQ